MTFDQGRLYNKFHIISIGLRTLDRLISHDEKDKAKEVLEKITKTSDEGMEYIKEISELGG